MKKHIFQILIYTILPAIFFSCETDNNYSNKDLNVQFGGTSISQITATSVQLSCDISNNMQTLSSSGFCIDKTKDPIISTSEKKYELTGANIASSSSINIGCIASSLDPETQYYARPYITVNNNVNYGQTVSFKTLSNNNVSNEVKKLPVVFHILYSDRSNPTQFVPTSTIKTILDKSNAMLRNTYPNPTGIDTKIELTLAQYDKNGLLMREPGIDRIESPTIQYDTKYFSDNRAESLDEMWDPSNYINIWIFSFNEDNVVGQSYIAYCTKENPLAGLNKGDVYFNSTPTYAHGVYMSNKFITDINLFSQSLTHEVGHYLGLLHVFDTKSNTGCDMNNDYCDDTNTYIRKTYEDNIASMSPQEVFLRKDCITSKTYEATNYMDYDYCKFTTFTPNQISRMHHVLKYSPLVPGATPPKAARSTTTTDQKPKARLM